jgi:peptide/nickel transport system substrate-binding protein
MTAAGMLVSRCLAGIALASLLAACAPGGRPDAPGRSLPETAAPRKILTIAIPGQPPSPSLGLIGTSIPGDSGHRHLLPLTHDALAVEWYPGAYQAQLATAMPTFDDGSWRLNPDGTMDVTWRLRPNARWHDGSPFTSADLTFSFAVYADPAYPNQGEAGKLMESVSAPDPNTLVVHWRSAYATADRQAPGGSILPEHLLGELYRAGDRTALDNHEYFRSAFVGLGPYRVVHWEEGSNLEVQRFEDYYQGRPPIDTIIAQFVPEANTMIANVLAGTVDVALPPLSVDAALEVKKRWDGTGNQVLVASNGKLVVLDPQLRPDRAQPRGGFPNSLVRQAFYYGLDRPQLADLMSSGLSPVADSYLPPEDALRKELEASIPQFPYDVARALALLAQAGWTRGADGLLVHDPDAERFETELAGAQGGDRDRALTVIAEGWKAIGADARVNLLPPAIAGSYEWSASRPGFYFTRPGWENFMDNRLHTREIASAENKYQGNNRTGYSNPKVDDLLDRLRGTMNPRERLPLQRDLVREQVGDVGMFWLYWEVAPILMVKGVKGPRLVNSTGTWNIFEWDRD